MPSLPQDEPHGGSGASAPLPEQARGWSDIRTWIRNSPWLAIAILLHIFVAAMMSIWYVAHDRAKVTEAPTQITVAQTPLELPPPIEEPPEIIDRDAVPVLEAEDEGPVNPDPVYVPDAEAGRPGEITDEIDPNKDPGIYNPDPEALDSLPSGATGGTPIGLGTVGHHGTGTPSAFVSRRAGGGGKGGGGLGQGGKGGKGGTLQTEKAVLAALEWLKRHQSPDGGWDSDGFSNMCEGNMCDGPGNALNDVGLTGLALLCFLGAGETHDSGAYKDTVKRGLKYLIEVQNAEGAYGEPIGQHFVYNHACAALAMTEAYGMTQAKVFRDPAQRGINFVLKLQNPYSAWRYAVPPDGTNDSSVTGWMVMVLKSAKLSNLQVDSSSMENALIFIDEVTDPLTGRTGYTARGERPSRMPALMARFPADRSEALTAVGMVARIFAGRTPETDEMINKGADLLVATLPTWDPNAGTIDYYYWYYATLAMFQVGGPRWDRWNGALKTALLDRQRLKEDEHEYGSWDPLDPWSSEGGRIYATAMNCLSMEVYYRYPRVFGTGQEKSEKLK